jgi:hypothetical protein
MATLPTWFLLIMCSWFKPRARLEAEDTVLRQRLIVLSRKTRGRIRLHNIDRLLFVWLHRQTP